MEIIKNLDAKTVGPYMIHC